MEVLGNILALRALFKSRIYLIFLALALYCLSTHLTYAQVIGAYRTIASGDFGDISIWEEFDGLSWNAALTKPNLGNDVYIDQGDSVKLTVDEQIRSLFLNSDAGAAQKLNLNGRNLDLYGSLQAFVGLAPGTPSGTLGSINWIGNSITSTLTFKGNSRDIILDGSWSAQSLYSRYSVIFDPGPGVQLTTYSAFKALKFTVKSGTLIQKINPTSNPIACATFSFNISNLYGLNEFGDFIIESDATFISQCNNNILSRSSTSSTPRPASLFHIKPGGELILEGQTPQIEAAVFQLEGKVTFRRNTGTQSYLTKNIPATVLPIQFHDLEIQGSRSVTLPAALSVNGNISQTGTGAFNFANTSLQLNGSFNQSISGFAMDVKNLTVDKPAGIVTFQENLNVRSVLQMDGGGMDFQGKNLTINSAGSSELVYNDGFWKNVGLFTYKNTPSSLTTTNSTFPFFDVFQGGIRKVQLLGNSAGGNLAVKFTEYKGADFNPSFNDADGTQILYRLFSYFQFSGLNSTSNLLKLKIAAQNLIVDDPKDIRLVCTGYAAPGLHEESLDMVNLWAIRNLTFNDLSGKNFTVGSTRYPSILPIIWLDLGAKWNEGQVDVFWTSTENDLTDKYEIFRFLGLGKELELIGVIEVKYQTDEIQSFSYIDTNLDKKSSGLYQLKKVNRNRSFVWSDIIRAEGKSNISKSETMIYPNPSVNGEPVRVSFGESDELNNVEVQVVDVSGRLRSEFLYSPENFDIELSNLPTGVYLVRFISNDFNTTVRWVKL